MNIRISGFGGQGVILSGVILGWAAILDGKNAIQTQSYGSSARGGACKCDVIIQDTDIYELEPVKIDILVSFSQPAYDKFKNSLKSDGTLFIDSDLVQNAEHTATKHSIPSTDIAFKEIGQKIMANIVMLGYLIAKTGIIDTESMEKSIERYVPAKFLEENINAFRKGMELD
ncbi:2-oxoacid:acceptor oxidoreductase family protein [Bacteroidota bacterium]